MHARAGAGLRASAFVALGDGDAAFNAWLPDSYMERGWGTQAAGGLLAVLNLI